MGEVQSDTEFQVELLSLRETVGKIFKTIFKTEVRERRQFTRDDIGVPDDDEIMHDALRATVRGHLLEEYMDSAYILRALVGLQRWYMTEQVDNSSDIR